MFGAECEVASTYLRGHRRAALLDRGCSAVEVFHPEPGQQEADSGRWIQSLLVDLRGYLVRLWAWHHYVHGSEP